MKQNISYAIIVLLLVFSGFLTYKVINNKTLVEPEDKTTDKGEVKEKVAFNKIETKGNKIIEYFDSNLNGTTKTIQVEFTYEKNGYIHTVIGVMNGTLVYSREYSEELGTFKKSDIFNEEVIKKGFTVENFDTLKGTDKLDYLIVYNLGSNANSLKVFTQDMTVIKNELVAPEEYNEGFMIDYHLNNICKLENGNPFYPNTFTMDVDKKIHVKKESDKIYFLAPVLNADFAASATSGNYGTLEERIYTITDNKLEYTVAASYKITEVCNQAW